jgi:hypothetical protein
MAANTLLAPLLSSEQEALHETQLQNEKARLESINQIIRERDAACEEKLASQKR